MSLQRRIFSSFLSIAALLVLNACQEKYTESYYYTHPQALKVRLHECQKENEIPESSNTSCAVAYKAAVQMTRLSQAFVNSPADFGQRILRSQIRAANTAKQLEIAEKAQLPTANLKKQVAAEEQHVDNLRAIVGLFIQM